MSSFQAPFFAFSGCLERRAGNLLGAPIITRLASAPFWNAAGNWSVCPKNRWGQKEKRWMPRWIKRLYLFLLFLSQIRPRTVLIKKDSPASTYEKRQFLVQTRRKKETKRNYSVNFKIYFIALPVLNEAACCIHSHPNHNISSTFEVYLWAKYENF